MGFEYVKAGIGSVGNYQVSGIPYVTGNITAPSSSGTPIRIDFPSVTQKVIIHNGDKNYDLRVGFSSNGVKNSNHIVCDGNGSNNASAVLELRVRCTSIFLLGADSTHNTTPISVAAELTGIHPGFDLTAAYSGGSGIG